MSGPVLAVENLSVRLPPGADRPLAVEDVTFEVRPREIVCVVGESGSGKSVTAFSIMGLLPPQLRVAGGAIRVQAEDVLAASRSRLRELRGSRMAMIFQEPMSALNPVLTVGDQIGEALDWHARLSRTERDERVRALVSDVRLPDPERVVHAYPHQLSGGQRQRVMIAMALANEPALIIADEPTTALDVTTQAQILKLFRELQTRHDSAILFITHDFGVVAEIAHRVVVMRQGRVVEQGPAEDVLRRLQHPYTRMLIAAVPTTAPRAARALRADAPTLLATKNLTKVFGEGLLGRRERIVRAVDEVTLELKRGETLGVVGESGSGKSTLARCVSRLIEPTAGEIRLDGQDIARSSPRELKPVRRKVQVIFQDPYRSLNPRRTVGASLVEGPLNYGVSRSEALARVRELLDVVGIDPKALERYPHQFSGGQRQRIAIARALAMQPDLLVADEAVSALDVSVQAQVLDLFEKIRDRLGLSILFITHDLRVAARLCDTLAVMLNGRVVEHGPAREIFLHPQHEYTQALFSAAPGRGFAFGAEAQGAAEPVS